MRKHTEQNVILLSDSYKVGHHAQYPPDMTAMTDHFCARKGRFGAVMFFGLQPKLLRVLTKRITMADVLEAHAVCRDHFGTDRFFPLDGWTKVVQVHGGKLPVRIRAVPEGGLYPTHAPLFVVESLDPELFWLVSWLEGVLQQTWYPTTVATYDFFTKVEMYAYLAASADSPVAALPYMLHDFGFRGASSIETAEVGGTAALVNFRGTDTLPVLLHARDYYGAEMAGNSVFASEHSTTTTWGREGERDFWYAMVRQFGDLNVLSFVSDSYDIFHAADVIFGQELYEEVMAMDAMLVIRPDSGDPLEVIARLLDILDLRFGSTVNGKGFKVLTKVRILQGDGIDHHGAIPDILSMVLDKGFSAENLIFGMGGGRLQQMGRDDFGFAIKCSLSVQGGELVPVFKDPITDPGKQSAYGYVDTVRDEKGRVYAVDNLAGPHPDSLMRVVYEYGEVLHETTMAAVRHRADLAFTEQAAAHLRKQEGL